MKNFLPVASLFVLATFGFLSLASADTAPTPAPVTIKQDRVSSITPELITITHSAIDTKASTPLKRVLKEVTKSYKIVPNTTIEVNGKKGVITDVQVGMAATVSVESLLSSGKKDEAPAASSIRVHGAPTAKAPATAAKAPATAAKSPAK